MQLSGSSMLDGSTALSIRKSEVWFRTGFTGIAETDSSGLEFRRVVRRLGLYTSEVSGGMVSAEAFERASL